ncbi:hypothetical protein niasHT_000131 [Heterodera trifolii]|uniref:Uncharacterized protein n=1 Tax=Heterodera trifolii TaxID=157864 RepID=A0ABD2M3L5_9BILA
MDRRHQSADHSDSIKRQLIKECAEMEEQISQLYERRIKQEKQLAEKDEIIKRLESDLCFEKAQLDQAKTELDQAKTDLRQKDEEIVLLKRKVVELQRVPMKCLVSSVADVSLSALPSSSSVQFPSVQQNIFADYELQPNSLVEHYNSRLTEAEQDIVTIFNQFGREQAEADQTIKQLEERIMEKEAEAKCRICLKHELEDTAGETNVNTKTYRHIGTQTTEVRAPNSWTFVILMIVLFGTFSVCCIILYQIRTIQNAVTLHYIRGPPPA